MKSISEAAATRRNVMMTLVGAAAAVTAVPTITRAVPNADAELLALEEQIFEAHEAATALDPEIKRLDAIVQSEGRRLYDEAVAAEIRQRRYLTPDERWNRVLLAMPEGKERGRLIELQDAHWHAMDASIAKMWAAPAHTPEGRRAKVLVLLGVILDGDWRRADEAADYEVLRLRSILFDFIGGEPGKQMRDQFA
jgi:hypothetical protein